MCQSTYPMTAATANTPKTEASAMATLAWEERYSFEECEVEVVAGCKAVSSVVLVVIAAD